MTPLKKGKFEPRRREGREENRGNPLRSWRLRGESQVLSVDSFVSFVINTLPIRQIPINAPVAKPDSCAKGARAASATAAMPHPIFFVESNSNAHRHAATATIVTK